MLSKTKEMRFIRNEEGLAYIEFALSVTFLLLLFFGAVEISRFMLIIQKVEKTVASVTDVTARSDGTTAPASWQQQETQLFNAVPDMMAPYNVSNNGIVILTDVVQTNGVPQIMWQTCGGGTLSAASKIGTPGGTASFASVPGSFTLANNGDEVVIGEMYYNYAPILVQAIIQPVQLYRVVVYVPRINTLSGFTPTCP